MTAHTPTPEAATPIVPNARPPRRTDDEILLALAEQMKRHNSKPPRAMTLCPTLSDQMCGLPKGAPQMKALSTKYNQLHPSREAFWNKQLELARRATGLWPTTLEALRAKAFLCAAVNDDAEITLELPDNILALLPDPGAQ